MTNVVIGAPVSEELANRASVLIEKLREEPTSVDRKEIVGLIVDLTKASFEYHFVRPLDDLGAGFATKKSVQMSLVGLYKILGGTVQKVVGGIPEQNLSKFADFIEDAYLEYEVEDEA